MGGRLAIASQQEDTPNDFQIKSENNRAIDGTISHPYIPDILKVRVIRRPELRRIIPLSDTTIYDLEQRGQFPRRYYLSSRCVVWNLAEVEDWLKQKQQASAKAPRETRQAPDVHKRKYRPTRRPNGES